MAHEQGKLLLSQDRSISRLENGHPGVHRQQPRFDRIDIGSDNNVVQDRS